MGKIRDTIYSRADFNNLKDAQRRLHDLLPIVDDAETCGIECQEYRHWINELLEFTQRLEQKFMSPPPKR